MFDLKSLCLCPRSIMMWSQDFPSKNKKEKKSRHFWLKMQALIGKECLNLSSGLEQKGRRRWRSTWQPQQLPLLLVRRLEEMPQVPPSSLSQQPARQSHRKLVPILHKVFPGSFPPSLNVVSHKTFKRQRWCTTLLQIFLLPSRSRRFQAQCTEPFGWGEIQKKIPFA